MGRKAKDPRARDDRQKERGGSQKKEKRGTIRDLCLKSRGKIQKKKKQNEGE